MKCHKIKIKNRILAVLNIFYKSMLPLFGIWASENARRYSFLLSVEISCLVGTSCSSQPIFFFPMALLASSVHHTQATVEVTRRRVFGGGASACFWVGFLQVVRIIAESKSLV